MLGADITAETARASFCTRLETPGPAGIPAVARGDALAFWHLFNDSPLRVVLFEYLADRPHPGSLTEDEIAETRRLFLGAFPVVPIRGTFWTDCAAD